MGLFSRLVYTGGSRRHRWRRCGLQSRCIGQDVPERAYRRRRLFDSPVGHDEHKYHCFRCGTQSLAEIDEGNVKIDICVNENCGAIHLDPGELKSIIRDQGALSSAKKAFLAVFKG